MQVRGRLLIALIAASLTADVAAQPPQAQPRFSASALAVVVDATVRDRDGKPMGCLSASDFEVSEDGVRQELSSFEAVGVPGCEPAGDPSEPASPPPLARVLSTPPLVTALVFEELGEQARVGAWHAAEAFIDKRRRPGEFVGVFVVERAVHTMTPYTRDRKALLAGVRRAAMRPGCPIYMAPDVASAGGGSSCGHGLTAQARATATLQGLQAVAGSLAHLPGRKNIVLFSEGFRVSADDNTIELYRRLTSDANQGTVTFHAIDASGPRVGRARALGADPTAYLERVALDTGGQYVSGTNDLTGAMHRVTADMRDYYRLTYRPTNEALDGRYRAIRVKVGVPGAVVTARNGYHAAARAPNPAVVPHDAAPHVLLDAGKLPADFAFACEATRTASAVAVSATVEGAALALATRPSGFEGALTVLARVRGRDGRVLAASSETFSLSGPRDQIAAAQNRQLRFSKTLPGAGAWTLEVIAYDVLSGRASARRFEVKDLEPFR
jgi:VWFA-related protein